MAGPPAALEMALSAPTLRLEKKPGAQKDQIPAILVSYVYVQAFLKKQSKYVYRDWMLDSGAYSAWNSGYEIDIHEYIATCKHLRKTDPTLAEIIALDVIGSDRGSLKNAIIMKNAGVEAMPVFHIGDDWGILKDYAAGWDKVGLSCRFGESLKDSYKFYDQCFARAWPKKFHSFGWIAEDVLIRYPFHSSDASSWEMGPCAFGSWKTFGKMSIRGSSHDLRAEVEWYLRLEQRVRAKWRPLFENLGWLPKPDVRLAVNGNVRSSTALRRKNE